MRYFPFLLSTLLALLSACGSTNKPALQGKQLPEKPEFTLQRSRGGALDVYFKYGEKRDTLLPKFRFLNSLLSAKAILIHPELGVLDTLPLGMSNRITGFEYGKDSLIIEAGAFWDNPNAVVYDKMQCSIIFTTLDTVYSCSDNFNVPIDSSNDDKVFIEVSPFIDLETDSMMTFALLAKRNRGATQDYHPTSERLRVEVYTQKGVLVFSTNYKANYLQELAPVEPRKRGEYKRFTFDWNMKDNTGHEVPKGKYKAVLSLVTKPAPYSSSLEFELSGNNK